MPIERGISVYVGLGNDLESIREYIYKAHLQGYSRLFSSLHIQESDRQKLQQEFTEMVRYAGKLGFRVTADISPNSFEMLGIEMGNIDRLCRMGIDTLRLDFGFNPCEIAQFIKGSALNVELNASTVDGVALDLLLDAGVDPLRLRACHNYYPRPETGLSYRLFAERSKVFRNHGIPVSAFIASHHCPRGPLYDGVPTLEEHRHISPIIAAKHFFASKLVDVVLFGDPLVAPEELAGVAALPDDCIELGVTKQSGISSQESKILFAKHTNRNDPGSRVIRSQEARGLCLETIVKKLTMPRRCGAITIDNVDYQRYMGELQVICYELPPDDRTNVVAQIVAEELFLLEYIQPGDSFCFKEM